MARVAQANTSTYIQGSVDYYAYVSGSNIIVDVYFAMRRTNAYSGQTYSSTAVPQICISSDSSNFGYSGSAGITVSGGQQNVWQQIYSASRTFSASRSGETIYVGWRVTNDNSGYLGGSAVAAITLPQASTAPNKPTVSINTPYVASVIVTYGTSSFGNPSSGTVYLYGGTSSSPTTQITSKTSTGNSNYQHTGLTGNTKYYYRARAKNSQLWSSYSTEVSTVTKSAPATDVSAEALTSTSIKIDYITTAGGGFYAQEIQYSIDGGTTWTTGDVVPAATTAATPGSFNITGLQPDTEYQIRVIVRTSAGTSSAVIVSATTFPSYTIYGSVNGDTKRIQKIYGSINGQTKEIKKIYGSVNGQTKRIF